jgi:hypothetical protein
MDWAGYPDTPGPALRSTPGWFLDPMPQGDARRPNREVIRVEYPLNGEEKRPR